jgi:hypothetical protein
VKASSRNMQLRLYKGNWATIEIMKTLLKNRRTYRNRIGVDEHDMMMKVESDDEEGSHEQNNGDDEGDNSGDEEGNNIGDGDGYDSWDDMYQAALRVGINEDNEDGGEDKGENGANSEDGDEDGGENMAENAADNEDGGGGEGGGENRDENNETESNGRRGVSGRKDDKGGNGMKRKNQNDEPTMAIRAKRSKRDVSRGHQVAAQPTKKAQPKKNSGKKKN